MSSDFREALAGSAFYPITDRGISGLSHTEQLLRLNAGGAKLIQLREKTASTADFYAQANDAMQTARSHGVKVIINDRVDIALALKADGVHLGQDDLPPKAARRLLGPDVIIGFSTHNTQQAAAATREPVNYIAIGPIFATQSKEHADPPVGLAGLSGVRKAVGALPLVAIGGITLENSKAVLEAGADAVALISEIWRSASPPDSQVRRFLMQR